jgi:hypothetical protein
MLYDRVGEFRVQVSGTSLLSTGTGVIYSDYYDTPIPSGSNYVTNTCPNTQDFPNQTTVNLICSRGACTVQ